MRPPLTLLALGLVLTLAACSSDDTGDDTTADASSNDAVVEDDAAAEADPATQDAAAEPSEDDQDDGAAHAELTIGGSSFDFEALIDCSDAGGTWAFAGAGEGPGGQTAELSASYYEDPPGSDVPGGEWSVQATEPGDTPGLPSGAVLAEGGPGVIRSGADDGYELEADATTFRITGPDDTDLHVTCGPR